MVPNKFVTILYKLWLEYNFKVVMFGDPNQCNPIEGGSQIYYDYINCVSGTCIEIQKQSNILRIVVDMI